MTSLAELEAATKARKAKDAKRLADARKKADEALGARLRALLAPDATRAEQVARADAWLTTKEEAKQKAEQPHGYTDSPQ